MLVKLHKLWMHYAQLLKDTRQCKDVPVDYIDNGVETTFKPGKPVMMAYHVRLTFEAKYLSDYTVLHQVNLTANNTRW